jgi:hypothetical protein
MRALCVIAVAGCWATSSEPDVRVPAPPRPDRELVMTSESFGTLDASSPGTLAFVREHFPDLDVRPSREDAILEYHAFAGSDELFFVVTNDDLSIFNVHVTSPKITSRVHDWRVGSAFHDAKLITTCECWGQNPTCYRRGEHVAVSFEMPCQFAVDTRDFRPLDGHAPKHVIWSPSPFGSRDIEGVDDPQHAVFGSDDDGF